MPEELHPSQSSTSELIVCREFVKALTDACSLEHTPNVVVLAGMSCKALSLLLSGKLDLEECPKKFRKQCYRFSKLEWAQAVAVLRKHPLCVVAEDSAVPAPAPQDDDEDEPEADWGCGNQSHFPDEEHAHDPSPAAKRPRLGR